MQPTDGYEAAAHAFLGKAREALASGDLVQASEKGWGAVAQMLKAVAERRGWPHRSHRNLGEAAVRLAQEAGDPRIRELFSAANGLHTNFYENWFPAELVEAGVDDTADLLRRLQPLLHAPGA